MEQEPVNSEHGSIGFFELLAVLFISLKLTDYIDWPWWVVLSPLWGGLLVGLVILGVLAMWRNEERRRRKKRQWEERKPW